jgi:hypothetical protein
LADVRDLVRQDWAMTTYGGSYKYKQLRQRLRPKDKAPKEQHLVALVCSSVIRLQECHYRYFENVCLFLSNFRWRLYFLSSILVSTSMCPSKCITFSKVHFASIRKQVPAPQRQIFYTVNIFEITEYLVCHHVLRPNLCAHRSRPSAAILAVQRSSMASFILLISFCVHVAHGRFGQTLASLIEEWDTVAKVKKEEDGRSKSM